MPQESSDTVLDAAAECYMRLGVAHTTAADIAKAAGISRATLYRRFGGHEAIVLAVVARESAAMAADAQTHLMGIDDPTERMVEGMMFSIAEISTRPVHAAVFGGEAAAWAASEALRLEAFRRISDAGIRPVLVPALNEGILSEQDVADLVDWVLRILVSYAAVPGPGIHTPDDIRRQLRIWFVPAFDRLMTGGSVAH
jgi:AcrR family transcriptional regulator